MLGLTSVPRAGDTFLVAPDDRTARQIAERREAADRQASLAKARKRISLEDLNEALAAGKVETLNLILKGDVSGSVEALEDALLQIDVGDEVDLRIIDRGVGAITLNNINLAMASDAVIIGFNVRAEGQNADVAEREGVEIRYYSVIYQAIEEIEAALKGMLKPEFEEVQLGTAEVREIFRSSKFGNIAGSIVRSGEIRRGTKARIIRDGAVVARRASRSPVCAASRTTSPRSARASSAVSTSGRSTTSRSATSSRPTRCARSRARRRQHHRPRGHAGHPTCVAAWAWSPARPHRPGCTARDRCPPARCDSHPSPHRRKVGPMADPARAKKIADRIKVIVAETLEFRVKDERLGFITITDVRVTGDLQNASVFYTVFGGDEERAETAAALESAKGKLRAAVGKGIGIRLTPTMEFFADALPDTAAHMEDAAARGQGARRGAWPQAASGAVYAGEADPYRKPADELDADVERPTRGRRATEGPAAGASAPAEAAKDR